MTEETAAQAAPLRQPGFNPKPDTAEGVSGIMEVARAQAEEYMRPALIEVELPDGTKAPVILRNDHNPAVMDPAAFDPYRAIPRDRRGTATLLDLASFIDHANRFRDEGSIVFADTNREAPSLTSVLDYHPEGADSSPRWGRHRGLFNFPLSDEWQAWHEMDGVQMEMPVFARFLEDHITDVLSSSEITLNESQDKFVRLLGGIGKLAEPAKLIELSKGFRVHESTATANAYVTATGEAVVNFENVHDTSQNGSIALPTMFAIGIPVFRDGERYQLLAQFRYRTGGGKVVFFYDLWRADLVFDHAIEEAIAEVQEATELPVFRGKPE